ncbi:hypothetical protein [Synechococcus sp. PCC 7336]|uniref:hypothetical protein n=1 Tax=Synechococcus sp. PCC 7336 TaxID=195250 RepID=UPI00034DBCBA|nr:hypothetical protein [Synechococcus sp. PCC 7336]
MSEEPSITPIPRAIVEPAQPQNTMAAMFAQLLQQLQPPSAPADPIAHIRALEDAYQNNWILGTSELAQLLKLAPKTLVRYDSIERYGFICERAGQNGSELGWKIRKPKSKKKK